MVAIQKSGIRPSSWKGYIPVFLALLVMLALFLHVFDIGDPIPKMPAATSGTAAGGGEERPIPPKEILLAADEEKVGGSIGDAPIVADDGVKCPYMSVSQLSKEEQRPKRGKRHLVTPPQGGLAHLVCCQSTKGPFNVMVHEMWAPLGAQRFLDMVKRGYFSSRVPLFRCLKNFICQFGLAGNPELSKLYRKNIKDDPQWLPAGKTNRENKQGVKRFASGYFAYAGGGTDTRNNQFIVSLADVGTLAGGSPWEVPWGELVGKHSFDTFSKVYTGYDEDGPSQGTLWKEGASANVQKDFPLMDYVTGCSIVDQVVQT